MSEEIEAGTLVWCRDDDCKWQKLTREYVGKMSDGKHICWVVGHRYRPTTWDEVTTENPHAPKSPEWLPEGYELHERRVGKYGLVTYKGSPRPHARDAFLGFAIKLTSGAVEIRNCEVWYTSEAPGISLCPIYGGNADIKAECLGAVMRKEDQ